MTVEGINMEGSVESANGVGQTIVDTDAVIITLPARARYQRVGRLVGSGLANELGFGVDRLDDVRLAIGESCALAAQTGARHLTLTYRLDEQRLEVTIDAVIDEPGVELDADYVALAEQVLAIACSRYEIDRDRRRMSIRITFANAD